MDSFEKTYSVDDVSGILGTVLGVCEPILERIVTLNIYTERPSYREMQQLCGLIRRAFIALDPAEIEKQDE